MPSAMMQAAEDNTKLSDKQRRQQAFSKVCELMRPYCGQVAREWTDKQHNSVSVWLVYSKEAVDGQHQWRGLVTVEIIHDGSTFFSFSEGMVLPLIGLETDASWEGTEKLMAQMIPPR